MELQFTQADIPRYSNLMLPEYRHLPFINAHPFLDSDGHSYGEKLSEPDSFTIDNWQNCADFLYSIDLFNHGFWWEAHERLKFVSLAAGRESETGKFVQGLIQIAAALLKHSMAQPEAATTLAEMGTANIQQMDATYLGIETANLIAQVGDCLKSADPKYPRIQLVLPTP